MNDEKKQAPSELNVNEVVELLQRGYLGSFRIIEKVLTTLPMKYGTNWASLCMLNQLAEDPNVSVNQLAELNHISTGAVSLRTRDLLSQGLIEIQIDKDDRRRRHLSITEAGRALQENQVKEARLTAELLLQQVSYDDVMRMQACFDDLSVILDGRLEAWNQSSLASDER
ncbi:MarR family winged helix-turn-helix transcriptional regulator [Furfurilactobacillus sp. WILCCON 0119]|uniref:MarR family winged helix-turn-helix transcriptional regulator n=1 Tax=Furfurilactobacillus entadae TaxID=2922307 RepID=UPI0035E688E6